MLVEVEKIIRHIRWRPIAEERVRKWAFITENRGDYLIQLKKIAPRLVTILLMRLE
jgi:hypothetical protein